MLQYINNHLNEGDPMSNDIQNQEINTANEHKKPEDYYGTFDTTILYEYKDQPDIRSGRCDNCGNAKFKSSAKNYVYIRECVNCGMKKNI